jgi:hypothetical protein
VGLQLLLQERNLGILSLEIDLQIVESLFVIRHHETD